MLMDDDWGYSGTNGLKIAGNKPLDAEGQKSHGGTKDHRQVRIAGKSWETKD